jgi:hypothetical protein
MRSLCCVIVRGESLRARLSHELATGSTLPEVRARVVAVPARASVDRAALHAYTDTDAARSV